MPISRHDPVNFEATLPASRWLIPLLVALLTVAAFLPSLQNGFVSWDDPITLVEIQNYRGLGWEQLRWMFTTFHTGHYQPLSWVTFGLDYLLWGMKPFGYHLTSLILHAVNAVLVYFLAYRLLTLALSVTAVEVLLLRISAGLAALIFAIHPLRVESVAWATERRDVLSSLFLLLTIHLYLWASSPTQSRRPRLWWLSTSLVAYGLSLLSRAGGMTLPVVLLVLDVYPLRRLGGRGLGWFGRETRGVWLEKVPYLILASATGLTALLAQYKTGAMASIESHGVIDRMAQAVFGLVFYLWKTIVPLGLSPLYEITPQLNPWEWPFLLSGILVVGITLSLLLFRRRWPAGLAVWICYVAILAPVLGIAQSGPQLVADRYSYVSCLGWAFLVGAGSLHCWRAWLSGRMGRVIFLATAGVATAVLVILSVLTWKQVRVWHNSEGFWRHALSVTQGSPTAHYNLAKLLADRSELDEAIGHYRQALLINPTDNSAHNNLGDALSSQGQLREAMEHYRQALLINPTDYAAHNNLGNALRSQGQLEEAIEHYGQALRIDPANSLAHSNLGIALAGQGKVEAAIDHFREALRINPANSLAHNNLGTALVGQGKIDKAMDHFREALRIDPTNIKVYTNLANILSDRGDLDKAIELYRRALEIQPGQAEVHEKLGWVLTQMGKREEAILHLEEAVRILKTGNGPSRRKIEKRVLQ